MSPKYQLTELGTFTSLLSKNYPKDKAAALLYYIGNELRSDGLLRILFIETLGLDGFELTRKFYAKHGYSEEARIREFYGPGDDKVVFWRKLN